MSSFLSDPSRRPGVPLTIVATLSGLALLAGCSKLSRSPSGDAAASASAGSTASATAASASAEPVAPASTPGAGKHRYEVKSGIVEMSNSMINGMQQTLYFDDYGARQTNVTSMDMKALGQAIHSEHVTIDADGYHVMYDPQKKTGTRRKLVPGAAPTPGEGMPPFDVANLTEEMKKQMKVETLPSKTIDGKTATGIYAETMGIKVRAWTWKGIPLYTEMDMGGMNLGGSAGAKLPKAKVAPIVISAKSVQVDVAIPAGRFTVPADVKITDM
jgi:hypothetical protein